MSKKRKVVFVSCGLVFLIALSVAIYVFMSKSNAQDIYSQMQEQNTAMQEVSSVSSEAEKKAIPVDFDGLKEINEDIYAWIKIPGTEIDYPIVQSEDDDAFYLDHLVDKSYGLPASIYTESLNSKDFTDANTLIYGHNMRDGSMFAGLHNYKSASFMEQNPDVYIYTPDKELRYKIFASVTYDDRHILKSFNFTNEFGMKNFINSLKQMRNFSDIISEDLELSAQDKVITLSTCTEADDQRFLVLAKLENAD